MDCLYGHAFDKTVKSRSCRKFKKIQKPRAKLLPPCVKKAYRGGRSKTPIIFNLYARWVSGQHGDKK